MNMLLKVLLFIALSVVISVPTTYWISMVFDRQTHKSMVKGESAKFGYAHFNKFKIEFDKVDWKHNDNNYNSLFYKENEDQWGYTTQIHASIFEFDNVGMIMKNTVDYIRANRYIRQYIKKRYPDKTKRKSNYNW